MGESIHFLGQRPSSQVARFNINLSTARPGGSGVWPLAVSKNLGTVFPNTDFPVGNNIHLFHSDTGSFKIRIRWLWGVWILSTRQLGRWYFNISVYRGLIARWFWWFGDINFMVKFGELSVHRVSLLSLESTQKKNHWSKWIRNFCFFSLFGLMPHVTEFLSAKSLALAKINIQMPYLDNNVFHNLTLFKVSHVHNSIQSACKRKRICLFVCCISHVYQSPSS